MTDNDSASRPDTPADQNEDTIAATGAETIYDVVTMAAEQGYKGNFFAGDGGVVMCSACRSATPADQIEADFTRRLEGASDPADLALIVLSHCAHCGDAGVLVLGYGPNADLDDALVLDQIDVDDAPVARF